MFKVIGFPRLGIKPESTVPEADALTTRVFALRRACCLTSAVQTYFSFLLKFLSFFDQSKPTSSFYNFATAFFTLSIQL